MNWLVRAWDILTFGTERRAIKKAREEHVAAVEEHAAAMAELDLMIAAMQDPGVEYVLPDRYRRPGGIRALTWKIPRTDLPERATD